MTFQAYQAHKHHTLICILASPKSHTATKLLILPSKFLALTGRILPLGINKTIPTITYVQFFRSLFAEIFSKDENAHSIFTA